MKSHAQSNHEYYLRRREECLRKNKIYKRNHPEVGKRAKENYKRNHPDKYREICGRITNRRRKVIRREVLEHYGGKCACCGETEINFLSIDHTNGRKKGDKLGGIFLCKKLKRENYPLGYQVLCFNCNLAKGFYGICPHKLKEERKNDRSKGSYLLQ